MNLESISVSSTNSSLVRETNEKFDVTALSQTPAFTWLHFFSSTKGLVSVFNNKSPVKMRLAKTLDKTPGWLPK